MLTTHEAHFHSLLFVPGDRPERFDKALKSGAHAIIIDLEDAVAPTAKAQARTAIASWASAEHPVLLRINGPGTPWFDEDVELLDLPGISGVVLPKAESSEAIAIVTKDFTSDIPVYPLIETAAGIWNVRDVASTHGVRQLLFGTLDFQVDMNIEGDGAELDPYRASLVLVSRVLGLKPPIDGVTPVIDDLQRLTQETVNSKRRGFAGKLCIHPKQVGPVNDVFRPSEADVAWAKRVLISVAKAQGAAVALDGKMVDRPVVLRAEQILASLTEVGDAA
ncbi:CoA ester lyase [Caballeronia sp. GAWG2-1]|uniref:HpcH/HpaI aldolase/citrate lyase family protein n=1 Tax=Caballeronia sp. GAWG2-1 TaxID=2921744 RepID=UPI0020288225|nr:CoA ester lyase [Caballeronia sp. GAWG2-1]